MSFHTHNAVGIVAHSSTTDNKVLLVASNDINGGTPHRHLTIDSNGRLLSNPLMTTTNSHLSTIKTNTTPTYENVSVDCSSVGTIGTFSASVDMDGKRHIALAVLQNASTGAGQLNNLRLQFSHDNTNWFRAQQFLTLEETTTGVYTLSHKIDYVNFRYVRLEVIAVVGSPTSTTLSISRSL